MPHKLFLSILFAGCLSIPAYSQNSTYNQGVFIEIGGSGGLYSLNYERYLKNGLVGRIGVAYIFRAYVVPITFGKVWGTGPHHLEATAGVSYLNYYQTTNGLLTRRNALLLTGFIGYRFQKTEKKFFGKIGLTPLYMIYNSDPWEKDKFWGYPVWFGIGLGTRF